uniref:Uncharacterized protein n=1 Tax=Trichogramma kaykai TaxID=54128 RepID=A0ABD2XEG8_9HYME
MGKAYSELEKYRQHFYHGEEQIPAQLMKKFEDSKWMRTMYSLVFRYKHSHPPESTKAYKTAATRYKLSTLYAYGKYKREPTAIKNYLLRVWGLNVTQVNYEQLMSHLEFKRHFAAKGFCLECKIDYLKNESNGEFYLDGVEFWCPPLQVNLLALRHFIFERMLTHNDPNTWDVFSSASMYRVCHELYNAYQREGDVSSNREMDLLKLLIEKTASIGIRESASEGHPIFQILSCHMYNVLVSDETEDTIHARAIMSGFEYQLNVYARIFFRDRIAVEAIESTFKKGIGPNLFDDKGNSLLSMAVSYLNYNVVKLLLERGADPKTVSFTGGYFNSRVHILLSFELVQNLVDIITLLKMSEYELSYKDKVNILNFIVAHKYVARYHNIGALLALGSPQLIRQNSDQVLNGDVETVHDENYRDIIAERRLTIERYVLAVKTGKMYRQDEGLFQEICEQCSG